MFEITLSEDLRTRLDALKDIALNQWRETGTSLFSPKSMPRLHFHVQPCPIVNTNTFYTLSTGLILHELHDGGGLPCQLRGDMRLRCQAFCFDFR